MHARFPAVEQAELAETFRGYGADPDTAARMAVVSRDPDTALPMHLGAVVVRGNPVHHQRIFADPDGPRT